MNAEILKYNSGQIIAQLEHSEKTLVSDVNFCLHAGESLALIGETGSGKTISAQSVMRLLPSNIKQRGGNIQYLGKELPQPRQMKKLLGVEIVYIPQNGAEFLNPSRRVRQHLYDSLKKLRTPKGALEHIAIQKLTAAGLDEPELLLDKYPFQLSGGMAQRVTIAISACSAAKLVIADEPTNGLDHDAKTNFIKMITTLFPDAAKLVITHDITVAELCDNILVLCGGRMMERGPSTAVLSHPNHPYTRALLGALVKNGMQETPRLRRETGFCPFYRRCASASERCRGEMTYHDGISEWWCSTKR